MAIAGCRRRAGRRALSAESEPERHARHRDVDGVIGHAAGRSESRCAHRRDRRCADDVGSTTTAVVTAQDSWGANRTDSKPFMVTVAPTAIAVTTTSLDHGLYQSSIHAVLRTSGGSGAVVVRQRRHAARRRVGRLERHRQRHALVDRHVHLRRDRTGTPIGRRTKRRQTLALTIDAPAFSIAVPAPAIATVGVPFQIAASSSGQVGSTIWSIASGSLPGGVGIDAATGIISGVPTTFGSFVATVRGRDSWNASRVAYAPAIINVAPLPISVATTALAAGSVRQAYQATLQATGGTGLTTWTIVSGSLPAGLALSNGIISGTPSAVGTSTFTVQAADAGWPGNAATKPLSITVGVREIVLYTSDATVITGTWSLVADAAAAAESASGIRTRPRLNVAAPLARPGELLRDHIPGRSRSRVSPVDARQGRQQQVGERFGLRPVLRLGRCQRRRVRAHRLDVGANAQHRARDECRRPGLGLVGRRVGWPGRANLLRRRRHAEPSACRCARMACRSIRSC